jgi:hypothetical protein
VLALPVNGTVPFFGGIGYPVVGAAVPYEVWTVVTGGQYAPPGQTGAAVVGTSTGLVGAAVTVMTEVMTVGTQVEIVWVE